MYYVNNIQSKQGSKEYALIVMTIKLLILSTLQQVANTVS